MQKEYLYLIIAEKIRNDILEGKKKAGDKLPSVRKLTEEWNCTPGTIQRAYKELSNQGLVTSRAGQGTLVQGNPDLRQSKSIRRANLVNKAEAFLLESMSSGYTQAEIEQAIQLAFDHWRVLKQEPLPAIEKQLRFAGSNDLAISWIASNFTKIIPKFQLSLQFGGSLSGLIAIAENRADLAGIHLWDAKAQEYNTTYIQRILPGKKIGLITLAHRNLGLMISPDLKINIHGLEDLFYPEVRFINRQSGSGTRVWFESKLRAQNLVPEKINGYFNEKNTHNDLARSIAEGEANTGIGLEAAAHAFNLKFIPLTKECYELAFTQQSYANSPINQLMIWLTSEEAKSMFTNLHGYDHTQSGKLRWVEY